MLEELVKQQQGNIDFFFRNLGLASVEKIVEILLESSGVVFFTGVGKSGFVAKKIAFTMVSTGTRAFYLSPTDALHGDLGMVSQNDTFVILSKSGESDELIALVPAIRNKGAKVVGVLCKPDSRLGAVCHETIILPFQGELCPYNMAPTTSTVSQMLFGDLLAIALMKRKNFTIDEFALNHPSGQLGKRITFRVKDLMLTGDKIPLCRPGEVLRDVLVELSNKRCGCVLVVDEQMQLKGIFTDGDLRRMLQKVGGEVLSSKMSEVMTQNPASIGPHVLAWDAMKFMEKDPLRRLMMLPVVDENQTLLGLLHMHDIIQKGI
jgi:arabinose-5-phosphate isomerase